ncbi:hypothetical protein ES703_66720 [subsurface metagenome]
MDLKSPSSIIPLQMITAAFALGVSAVALLNSSAITAPRSNNRHGRTIAIFRSALFILRILPLYCWFGNINNAQHIILLFPRKIVTPAEAGEGIYNISVTFGLTPSHCSPPIIACAMFVRWSPIFSILSTRSINIRPAWGVQTPSLIR